MEIICGSMPALAGFFRRHNINVSMLSSLKNPLSRFVNRSSRSRDDINMRSFERVGSGLADNQNIVETKILGSIRGDGKFLKSGNTHSQWLPPLSSAEPGMPTRREGWE